ncbi:Membrane-bound acyltransferase YfiQ, involved in biofilm formation [Planococcus glaciei]|uniref:acyltransferase family protein n=1 Tax=Planococcus glaciei TaxID=459472 RepID=UPI000885EDC0|nr:acyltransferase family protein [Planococcus glaciei]SDH87808.1 Membrane-bound acyltransferase YfiQ, involved in biofilm formation [Planococcus glaciei]
MKNLNEINIIRALMCISIVLTHSISNYFRNVEADSVAYEQYQIYIRFALLCSTPIFILLSETLISKNYPGKLKKGFWGKRFAFILLPYILIGLVVSYKSSHNDWSAFLEVAYNKIVLGEWYGFFVLVIFQFYFLHWLIGGFLARIKPAIPIVLSFILSFAHIYGYVHNETYQSFIIEQYPFWYKTHILFWLFYFITAFYIGQYYEQLVSFLTARIWLPTLTTVLSFALVMYNYKVLEYTRLSSERYDMLLYAVSIFFLLVALIRKFNLNSQALVMISNFSFFIYLTHMIFLPYFVKFAIGFGENFFVYIAIIAFLTVSACIGVAFLFYQNRITRLFTGKIKYLEPVRQPQAPNTQLLREESNLKYE